MKLLKVLSIGELKNELRKYIEEVSEKIVLDLDEGLNHFLADDIYAIESVPHFRKSTVDGYALNFKNTQAASTNIPAILKYRGNCPIGVESMHNLLDKECLYINTGSMLPKNANAVVMVENTEFIEGTNDVLVYDSLSMSENVTLIGDDIKNNQLLFKKNHYLDQRAIATLASQGIMEVSVYRKMSCVVISSGNELIDYTNKLESAKVRDINTLLLKNELIECGFDVVDTVLIKDDYQLYKETLEKYDVDLYITSGGSSQGNEDYTYDIFNELTDNVLCHGLAIKPGKPTIAARKDNKFYLGLPGNPVSAYLVLKQTLVNGYHELYKQKYKYQIKARLEHNIQGSPGKDSLILVKLESSNNEYSAVPIYYRSSNVLSLASADGYFIIGMNVEGINENEIVEVTLF